MARRQKRFSGDSIHGELNHFFNFMASIVMKNKQVYYLKIMNVSTTSVETIDMRKISKKIIIQDIEEVIVDI